MFLVINENMGICLYINELGSENIIQIFKLFPNSIVRLNSPWSEPIRMKRLLRIFYSRVFKVLFKILTELGSKYLVISHADKLKLILFRFTLQNDFDFASSILERGMAKLDFGNFRLKELFCKFSKFIFTL